MKFEFKPSFERSIKSLHSGDQAEIKEVAMRFVDILSLNRQFQQGLGLKRLAGDYWEIRKGIRARILFRWEGDRVEFVLAGNHDDIKRFLRNL